jgi:hypothetical protein
MPLPNRPATNALFIFEISRKNWPLRFHRIDVLGAKEMVFVIFEDVSWNHGWRGRRIDEFNCPDCYSHPDARLEANKRSLSSEPEIDHGACVLPILLVGTARTLLRRASEHEIDDAFVASNFC